MKPSTPWLLLWLCCSVIFGALYIHVPPSPDQAIFDYIGWIASKGGRFYVDATEQNWPGAMLVHEASTRLFGARITSFRLFDYFWVLFTCGVLFYLCTLAKQRLASLIVVPLYLGMYVTADPWLTGQRDIISAHWLLMASVCLLLRQRGKGRIWLLPLGLLTLMAVITRPTYLLFVPLLFGADLLMQSHTRRRPLEIVQDTLICAAIFVLGALGLAAAGWSSGALVEWYTIAVRYNAEIYSRSQTYVGATQQFFDTVRGWHWYWAFGLGGLISWWRSGERPVLSVLFALVVTSVGSAYVQLKGFGYHLGGLLPVLAIFASVLIARSYELMLKYRTTVLRLGFAAVLAITFLGISKKLWGSMGHRIRWYLGTATTAEMLAEDSSGQYGYSVADVVTTVELIKKTVPENGTVLTWGRPVLVNFLAERRSPTRFITIGMLELVKTPSRFAERWAVEFKSAFEQNQPQVILVPMHTDEDAFWMDPSPSAPVQFLRDVIRERYQLERTIGSMEFYRLKAPG
jgi:hypothetical protein